MRPTIQMIFRVREVRERENGGLMVMGYVADSRDAQGNWHFVDVTVFLPESNQAFIDAGLQLMEGQRVFVSGPVSNGSYMSRSGAIRDRYTISYPTAFVPLDTPTAQHAEEAVAEEAEPEPVVQQPVVHQPVAQQTVKTQPRQQPVAQQPAAPRVVEMEGTARPTRNNSQQQATGTALRPKTITVPRAQQTVVETEPAPVADEDDPNYDPFAEP